MNKILKVEKDKDDFTIVTFEAMKFDVFDDSGFYITEKEGLKAFDKFQKRIDKKRSLGCIEHREKLSILKMAFIVTEQYICNKTIIMKMKTLNIEKQWRADEPSKILTGFFDAGIKFKVDINMSCKIKFNVLRDIEINFIMFKPIRSVDY